MKIKINYTIELTEEEAQALWIILGHYKPNDGKRWGLTDEQRSRMSEIFRSLPFSKKEGEIK